jgi:hypothetical protein
MRLSFVGTYPDLLSYLTQLGQLPVITAIDSLNLKRSLADPHQLEVSLALSAFLMPAQAGEADKQAKSNTPISLLANPFIVETELPTKMSPTQMATSRAKSRPVFKLQGIWKGKQVQAFINGRVVKVGDKINGYQVARIGDQKVVLTKGSEQYTLSLK